MMIEAELKTWGNSYGIRIPKKTAKKLHLEHGSRFEFEIIKRYLETRDGFGMWRDLDPKHKHVPFVRDHDDRY